MVITKLTGGLGNQMFQYSLGRIISLRNNCKLYFDISEYSKIKMHNGYELDKLNIDQRIFMGNKFISLKFKNKIINFILSKINKNEILYYREKKYFKFDENVIGIKKPLYIDGYWQSYKYIELNKEIIAKDFDFKINLNKKNIKMYEEIKKTNSVSVHIRRGDYISNKNFSKVHNVLEKQYYEDAISYIKKKLDSAYFFIFSDDPEWAIHNINHKNCIHVSDSKSSSIEELFLMKSCNHNVIANSSFSWWGAWLNNNQDKVIIAPKKWLKINLEENSDLIPENWIRL